MKSKWKLMLFLCLFGLGAMLHAERIAQWNFQFQDPNTYGDHILVDTDTVNSLEAYGNNFSSIGWVMYAASPPDLSGSAADMRGNAFLNVPDNQILTGYNDGGSGFTALSIDAYIYLRSLGAQVQIVRKTGGGTDNDPGYQFYVDTDGTLNFRLNDWYFYSTSATAKTPVGTITTSQWYRVTGTWDGSTIKVFVDANELGSTAFDAGYNTVGVLDFDTEGPLGIGGWESQSGSYTYTLNGVVDNVVIYNEAITPTLCGIWGFSPMDFDLNCYVDLADFAEFASEWMVCTMPLEPNCVSRN